MKNSFKYILSAASFLLLTAGVSFAQGIEANKSVAPNDKGGYTLTLEAWATGDQVERTETVAQPLDIVLVLDVSGSMNNSFGSETISVTEMKYSKSDKYISSITDFRDNEYYYSKSGYDFYKKITASQKKRSWGVTYYTITLEDGSTEDVYDFNPYVKTSTSSTRTKTRLDALKDACSAFITTIENKAAEDGCEHQISVVKFASDKSDAVGDRFVYSSSSGTRFYPDFFNLSQVVIGLTSNFNSVRATIDDLQYGGATRSDYGLEHAYSILSGVERNDSHKVVVLFTDGTPGTSGWDTNVANAAISAAKDLKDDKVTVYTVGIFDTVSSDVNNYMNYVSSNYPSAVGMTSAGTRAGTKYFMTANDPSELNNIFTTISKDAADDANTVELTSATSSIRDYVTPQFNLDGEPSDVRIFTVDANGKDSFDESTKSDNLNGQLTNNDPENPNERFAVLFQKGVNEGEKKVLVTGFDFKKHWVGEVVNETTGTHGYNEDGQKIVIEIDIKLAGDVTGVVETNTSDSGIYAYDKNTGETVQEATFTKVGIGFPVPQLVAPSAYLHIKNYFNADGGEQSAIFEIFENKEGDDELVGTVMLTDSNDEAYLLLDWLNAGDDEIVTSETLGDKMKSYTVRERGWSMNEISRTGDDSSVNTLYKKDSTSGLWVENIFEFTSGTSKTDVKHAETYVLDVE